jgi:hypothetical protein
MELWNRLNQVFAPSEDGRPPGPVMQIDSPVEGAVATGLLPTTGWAYTGMSRSPEGIVELALDDEQEWVELTNRRPLGGIEPHVQWAKRCGFETGLNTFLLSNGDHRLRLRVKTPTGRVAQAREVHFRIENVGRLAQTTANLLKRHPGAKRIWTDLIDSDDFPFDEARNIAWFERPDAEAQIDEIVSRHQLDQQDRPHLLHFVRKGYIVIENFISKDWCEQINSDLDSLIRSGVLHYRHKGQRVE